MPATIHPAFLAIAAVIGLGYALYSIFSESENPQEGPHRNAYGNDRRPPTPPSERREQYDTHPNLSRRRNARTSQEGRTDCTICLETLRSKPYIKLYCTHFFHSHCLRTWLLHKLECPTCRRGVSREDASRLAM